MNENKIDFNKYLKKLEGYTENFDEKLEENNKKVNEFNQKIEKDSKAIEALGSYYLREEGKTSKGLNEFEKSSRPYQNSIRVCEDNIRDIEQKNEVLKNKKDIKNKIIEKIIKDATDEFNAFEENVNKQKHEITMEKEILEKKIKSNNEAKSKMIEDQIDELKKKIAIMDKVGNKKERTAQEKLEEQILILESKQNSFKLNEIEGNDKLKVAEYEKKLNNLDEGLKKNKIEFKRKINAEFLNGNKIGEILKEQEEKEQAEIKRKEKKEELANLMAEGRKNAIEKREAEQIEDARKEELANLMAEGRKNAIEKREAEPIEETKNSKKDIYENEVEEEIPEIEESKIPKRFEEYIENNETQEVSKNSMIEINGLANEVRLLYMGKEIKKNEAIIDSEERKALYKRIDINKIIGESIESKNIFKILNLKRKLDPAVVRLLQEEEYAENLDDYITSIYTGEELEKIGKLKYDLNGLDGKEQIEISKYAKHASGFAEIEGELAKGVIGRTIDGIKRISGKLFNKVKNLPSLTKTKLLGDGTINKENLPEDIKNNIEYLAEEQKKFNIEQVTNRTAIKMEKYKVGKDIKDNCDNISWKYSKKLDEEVKEAHKKAQNEKDSIDEYEYDD